MQDVISKENIENLKDLMGDGFPELVATYSENARKHLDSIGAGLASGDAHKVEHAAHPLKSSSANMGVKELAALAEEIENIAESDGDLAQAQELYEKAKALFDAAEKLLQDVADTR